MTEKQFSALRTTLIGAAFFIGGAIFSQEEWQYGVLFMIFGGIFLIKDGFVRVLQMLFDTFEENLPEEAKENMKKEHESESD